jgi:ABC-2 type transport system permease protein
MTGAKALRLVAAREVREALRRKTFWIIAGVVLAGSSAAMIIPEVIGDSATSYDVAVVGRTPSLDRTLLASATGLDIAIKLRPARDIASARRAVMAGDVDAAAIPRPHPTVIVKSEENARLVAVVQQALSLDAVSSRLDAAGLSARQIGDVLASREVRVEQLDTSSSGRRGASAAIGFVLYIVLFALMMQVATSTAIEKSNRISEVLLPIVRPGALLFGKVIGTGLVGMLTVVCALAPVVVKLAAGGSLPEGIGGALVGGAAWFLIGIALYMTIAGALGALVERQEEAGSATTPLSMALVGSFLVSTSAPESPLGTVLGIVPLSSSLVMPARIAIGVASGVEMAASLVVGVLAVVLAVRFGASIYRRAIVSTGKRLRLREVLRAAR